jgi:hypothetical protein
VVGGGEVGAGAVFLEEDFVELGGDFWVLFGDVVFLGGVL